MSGIASKRTVNGNVHVATTYNTVVSGNYTSSEFFFSGNSTLYLQVLDNSTKTGVLEKGSVSFIRVHVYFDGVSLTIEGTLILVGFCANHGTINASVNVGRQYGVGKDLSIIHQYSKLFQVSCCTNLVYLTNLVERIRRHTYDHHDGRQANVK